MPKGNKNREDKGGDGANAKHQEQSKAMQQARKQFRSSRGNRFHQEKSNSTTTMCEEGGSSTDSIQKVPKHLRGKEIGLWYARRSKERNKEAVRTMRTIGSIIIPTGKAHQISTFLNTLSPLPSSNQTGRDGNYEGIPNSKFKRNYLDVIKTNVMERPEHLNPPLQVDFLDEALLNSYKELQAKECYWKMLAARKRLPAFKLKSKIIDMISTDQIVIISGETGCGKTTQIPQFILDDYLENKRGSLCRIVCTQPRRISAISVAERIAEERCQNLGESVGYHIRLESVLPPVRGSIVFCTVGIILKKMESDVGFEGVSHLILDEIHERDVLTDFLLALLKQVVSKWSHLKIVLMSATLNAEKFAQYFGVRNFISIPGFNYNVKEYYLEDALLRTGFQFTNNPKRMAGYRFGRREFRDKDELKKKEFRDVITPYVRRLRDLHLYPPSVCSELAKEASEVLNLDLAVALIQDICKEDYSMGAILVFLPGFGDIWKMSDIMTDSGLFPQSKYLIFPLHSQMATMQQQEIFNPPPPGMRKIILATNIAETSITIDDIVYVIDCGKIKISEFNAGSNAASLTSTWVSQANADQRRGRAGRTQPGICYHLFSKARSRILPANLKPEILRQRLDGVILNLKLLKLGSAEKFLSTCLDPPNAENITNAVDFLKRLNALDENETLTPLGFHLARLPVSPQLGKMMLLGTVFSCANPIVDIASALDFKDAFLLPLGHEVQSRERKCELAGYVKSDHLLFHNAMFQFEHVQDQADFCWEYYLSEPIMSQLSRMKCQFGETLKELDFLSDSDIKAPCANENSTNVGVLKAIICGSLYPNVLFNNSRLKRQEVYHQFYTLDNKKVEFHPKSIIKPKDYFDSPFLVYFRKVKSTNDFVHDATMINTLPLMFFGDAFNVIREENSFFICINDTLRVQTNEETLNIIKELRKRLAFFLEMKTCQPVPVNWSNADEVGVLAAIVDLITIDHQGYGLENLDSRIDHI